MTAVLPLVTALDGFTQSILRAAPMLAVVGVAGLACVLVLWTLVRR